jgi:amyloid beta precursor protein binding protein 1
VFRRAQQLLVELNLLPDIISERDARNFCKHAADLHVVRGRCIADEYEPRTANTQEIGTSLYSYPLTVVLKVLT